MSEVCCQNVKSRSDWETFRDELEGLGAFDCSLGGDNGRVG